MNGERQCEIKTELSEKTTTICKPCKGDGFLVRKKIGCQHDIIIADTEDCYRCKGKGKINDPA